LGRKKKKKITYKCFLWCKRRCYGSFCKRRWYIFALSCIPFDKIVIYKECKGLFAHFMDLGISPWYLVNKSGKEKRQGKKHLWAANRVQRIKASIS
jgi:hypothetical protein